MNIILHNEHLAKKLKESSSEHGGRQVIAKAATKQKHV